MLYVIFVLFSFFPVLSTILTIPLLLLNYQKKSSIAYIIMISYSLSMIGYYLIPEYGLDGYYYKSLMMSLRDLSYFEMISLYEDFKVTPLSFSFFYFVSQTHNYSLAPALSVFVTYSTLFYIFFDFARQKKIAKLDVMFSFLLLVSFLSLISIISGMRFNLGYTAVAFGLYREFIQKKSSSFSWLLYIFAVLIHSSFFSFLLIRVLIPLYKGSIMKFLISIILLTWSMFEFLLPFIFNLLPNILGSSFESKFRSYEEVYNITNSNAMVYLVVYYLYCILILILIVYLKRKENDSELKHEQKYYDFLLMYSCLAIGGFLNDIFIIRFATVLMSMAPIVVMRYLSVLKNYHFKVLIYMGLLFFSLLGMNNQKLILSIPLEISVLKLLTSNMFSILFK